MDERSLHDLIDGVRRGAIAPDDAVNALRRGLFADLGFARVDHHRALRQGVSEVVYAPGKTPEQCVAIVAELLTDAAAGPVLVSRADKEQAAQLLDNLPDGQRFDTTLVWRPAAPRSDRVVIAAAGTSDLPVADECAATLAAHGIAADRCNDVGVAGIHRLLVETERLQEAQVVIVVAGMEGALASVVGGLTPAPVIAVPTSVGYGTSLEGVTALLAMLSSCAAGVTVVGIDNGFGAASAALRLLDHRPGASSGDDRGRPAVREIDGDGGTHG